MKWGGFPGNDRESHPTLLNGFFACRPTPPARPTQAVPGSHPVDLAPARSDRVKGAHSLPTAACRSVPRNPTHPGDLPGDAGGGERPRNPKPTATRNARVSPPKTHAPRAEGDPPAPLDASKTGAPPPSR
ncbi:hypothetical protein GCM10009533_37550 [Saccharopolyspora spinosporotrichia]|uniref:Uncharacterized protein n=1 Tax=Saccharopolyspora erythraea TaxID=1836 RepID=A0ABP3N489_SACER